MSISRAGGNGTQACAACKYQRRKCAPDCILAPYFPHDRQRQFLNAHKLFGVSNITKIIRDLDPPKKDLAMRTIIYQSDVRASDPVGGCYRIIRDLQHQIDCSMAELDLVLRQLELCRAQAHHHQQNHFPVPEATTTTNTNSSTLTNSDNATNADPLSYFNAMCYYQSHQLQLQQEPCNVGVQHHLQDPNTWGSMQDSSTSSSLHAKPQQQVQQQAFVKEYCDDMRPLSAETYNSYERDELKLEVDQEANPERLVTLTPLLMSK